MVLDGAVFWRPKTKVQVGSQAGSGSSQKLLVASGAVFFTYFMQYFTLLPFDSALSTGFQLRR